MSDSPNNTPQPPSPNRASGDNNGFNWRVLALFSLALVILGVAFFGPQMNPQAKTMSYAEFRTALDQERVVL